MINKKVRMLNESFAETCGALIAFKRLFPFWKKLHETIKQNITESLRKLLGHQGETEIVCLRKGMKKAATVVVTA